MEALANRNHYQTASSFVERELKRSGSIEREKSVPES